MSFQTSKCFWRIFLEGSSFCCLFRYEQEKLSFKISPEMDYFHNSIEEKTDFFAKISISRSLVGSIRMATKQQLRFQIIAVTSLLVNLITADDDVSLCPMERCVLRLSIHEDFSPKPT